MKSHVYNKLCMNIIKREENVEEISKRVDFSDVIKTR